MTQVVKHILIFSNFVNYCEAHSILDIFFLSLLHPLQHYTVTFTVSKMKRREKMAQGKKLEEKSRKARIKKICGNSKTLFPN